MTDNRYMNKEKAMTMISSREQQHPSSRTPKSKVPSTREELQNKLFELLSLGRLVITPDWNFLAGDWVTDVHIADIDDDGDVEIIAAGRDGYVRALTRLGTLRWETRVGSGSWITTIAIVPSAGSSVEGEPQEPAGDDDSRPVLKDLSRPRIIVGTRDGRIYALKQNGDPVENWVYQIENNLIIHQIVIHPARPEEVIVGAEDRCVHLLSSATGALKWKESVKGRVYSICVADIDGDGEQEIMAVTSDKCIHILDHEGKPKGIRKLAYKSYVLAVAEAYPSSPTKLPQPAIIFSSNNGKDLCGWTVAGKTHSADHNELKLKKTWTSHPLQPSSRYFQGRVQALHIADINDDGQPEILVGSADRFLSIFDHNGQLLWKHSFGQSVYSIYAYDYDNDGITEVVVGLGDNTIRALKIELDPRPELISSSTLYLQIHQNMQKLRRSGIKIRSIINDTLAELANDLGLLQDEEPELKQSELGLAEYKLAGRKYKEALAILMRLKEQGVQQYWDRPLTNLDHIRDLSFGDVKGNPIDEIIVGNDGGWIIALDINGEENEKMELWKRGTGHDSKPGSSVVSLQTGKPADKTHEMTMAVLEDRSIFRLNNDGTPWPLPSGLLEPDDRVSSLYVVTSQVNDAHQIERVILGLENHKIYLYDAELRERLATIPTKQSVKMVSACNVTSDGQIDILAGTAQHTVCFYTQHTGDPGNYREQWCFQTEDRIRALYAANIDGDDQIEILIGSEDRNLYVLNHRGQLKWRYFMPNAVLSIDVCDIDNDGEYEVLVGVDDGFLYILSCQGDLLQKLPTHDRVRVIRAKDLHPASHQDGLVEIAVATDDRLMLLQVLHNATIQKLIEECWRYLRNNEDDIMKTLREYGDYRKEKNEYIRAFALTRIAGTRPADQLDHSSEDFGLLRRAVAADPSPVVAQALARAIVNLCRTSKPGDESFRWSQQLLQRLAKRPQQETRIAIVHMLDELAKDNPDLSFEYLERFLGNDDLWLRRMVIRQLCNLVDVFDGRRSHPDKKYSDQIFRLLQSSAHDELPWLRQETGRLWLRQETGRSLAHYFDKHTHTLFEDLHKLLGNGIDPAITEQIAICSVNPAITHIFEAYTCFQRAISSRLNRQDLNRPLDSLQRPEFSTTFQEQKKQYEADLALFVTALQETIECLPQAEDLLVVYRELQNLLRVKEADDIEQFRRDTEPGEISAFSHFQYIDALIARLMMVVETVRLYWKREAFTDKAATLIETIYALSQISNQYIEERHQAQYNPHHFQKALTPEDILLRIILQQWYAILRKELRRLRGTADLSIELTPNSVQREETIDLFFQIANSGTSAADHLEIRLGEDEENYEIVSPATRQLEELSSQRPQIVSFRLKPLTDSFRIETIVTYKDAERGDHFFKQGHKVELKKAYNNFKKIANPYHGGTPTSDPTMFYGREDDLKALGETLSNTTTAANRVILLIGQRRSGKTSLMYQLETRLQPHIVVRIDLQSLAMSASSGELFSKIVQAIQGVLSSKGFPVPQTNELDFIKDPTQMLDRYLTQVTQQLGGRHLILLFDEFEVFNQLIQEQRLDAHFLHYLRSLMQHRLGINFLLAGAPHVLLDDRNNRSAFLNIAQHHRLTKLKREEAEELIVAPVKPQLTYDPLVLERIHYLTGDQPYLIHLLCEALVRHCNEQKKDYANTNDIKAIIPTVLERGENHFGTVLKLAASPEERLLLSIMAGDPSETQSRAFSLADLKTLFNDLGCPYHVEKIRLAIRHLKREEIIEENSEGRLFTIPVGLIRIWLSQNSMPARIVREEFSALEIER